MSSKRQRCEEGSWKGTAAAGARPEELPVTVRFSMRCGASALSERKDALAALEASLKKVAEEFGGSEFQMARTRVGPSDDTLQRALSIVLVRMEPEVAGNCYQTCTAWRKEMEACGFCYKTYQLCASLGLVTKKVDESFGTDEDRAEPYSDIRKALRSSFERFRQHAQRRLAASTSPAERTLWLDADAFLQRSWECRGTVSQWLQAASQEPAASVFSRGAVSTASVLGLPLVQWVGKPQGRHPGFSVQGGHGSTVRAMAFSPDGTQIVTGGEDALLMIWDAATSEGVCPPPPSPARHVLCCTARSRAISYANTYDL